MIRAEREYRNLGRLEAGPENADSVTGYASTFDTYPLFEEDGVTYYERIDRNAFAGADMSDVVFLRDHAGRVLARTKNGSIDLWVDDNGLGSKTDLSLTTAAREMAEDIRVGNYAQMSFSFVVERDHFEGRTRVIDAIKKLYDISAVAFPANPYTEIGISARDLFHGVMEQETAERLAREQRERKRKALQTRIRILQEASTWKSEK